MERHGFASELHKEWMASPAIENEGAVTCHDPSGFLGSWKMKDGGVFFASERNEPFDGEAMKKALEYCREMNSKL